MRPLLGEGGVVDHEDRGRVGELRRHRSRIASQGRLLVPGALAEELLQGLVGVGDLQPLGQRDAGGHRLDALAVAVGDQAAEVDAAPGGLAWAVEVVAEGIGVVGEPAEDVGGEFGGVGPVHTIRTNRVGQPFVRANGVALGRRRSSPPT